MKRCFMLISLFLAAALLLTACSVRQTADDPGEGTAQAMQTAPSVHTDTLEDPADGGRITDAAFSLTAEGGGQIAADNGEYLIRSGGEYVLSGALTEGRVIVEAGEEEVTLILQNASVTSSKGAPIAFVSAGNATLKAESGTYNAVCDRREGDPDLTAEDDGDQDAAIWAACDLKIGGKGILIVTADYDNGIKSKDDLKIRNLSLKVTSVGCALKGNDSVTVQSGNLILTSTGSDGVKTSRSDLSEKGNQRGTVTFEGGHTDIYAARDGVSAAYDAVITQNEEACTVNVFTAAYADPEEGGSGGEELYLIIPTSLYSDSVAYYARFYNGEEEGVWRPCEYETMVRSGRNSYYGLLTKAPDGYQSVQFCTVAAGAAPNGENSAAATDGETVNASMNGYLITSVSGGQMAGDWVQLSAGSGSSSDKTAFSSKGIKAANEIRVEGGSLTVFSMDDALHANGGDALENGSAGAGNVTVSGGTVSLTAADDGIRADSTLTVSGGTLQVVRSHEGLEANLISLEGGSVFVYGEDDGLNACRGSQTPLVRVTGGYLEVTTPSGDTDAVDSNGSFTMSGGFALIKGGSAMGGMAGSVDVDGSVTVTGGTIVALGGICEIPESGSVNVYASGGAAFTAGEYRLTDGTEELLSFTLDGSYSSCWIASDLLRLNGSYTLFKNGDSLLEWEQTSSLAGNYSGGMGGGWPGGGPGGGPGGRR